MLHGHATRLVQCRTCSHLICSKALDAGTQSRARVIRSTVTAATVLRAAQLEPEGRHAVQGAQFSTPPSIYDSRAHLLHGALHLNGFGHLLRVNGGPPAAAGCCNLPDMGGTQHAVAWPDCCLAPTAAGTAVGAVAVRWRNSTMQTRRQLLQKLWCFGFLATGVEGGSGRVAGRQLMDLWDALCTLLGARQVSVEDVSNKVRGALRS